MTTAEDYATLAQAAYKADPLWKNPPFAPGQRFNTGGKKQNQEFVVVPPPPTNDPVTGFQAMTVVPVVNHVPDYSQVHIAYAGTNPAHHPDISADGQGVVGGQTGPGTQADQALAYAKQVMATYPGAGFDTAGHSLGGFLAEYVSGKLHIPSTTFNAPDAWESLSEKDKKWYLAEVAAGRRPWDRYVNEWDVVGNYHGNPSGSAIWVKGKPGQDLVTNHNIPTAFYWNPDGSVKGAGAMGRSLQEVFDNLLTWVPDDMRPGMAMAMAGTVAMLQNPVVGAAVGGVVSGLAVTMDTLAASSMAANILQMEAPLQSIRAANGTLIPRMEQALRAAKNAVAMIPSLTEADIENCVAVHRLQVHHNIDKEAVAAVNRRVDEHLTLVHQLVAGVGSAAQNALAQDAQWAEVYGGH